MDFHRVRFLDCFLCDYSWHTNKIESWSWSKL